MDDDRAGALAEAYKRGILPPEMKAAYEEATKRGLVGKAEPSAYQKSMTEQRAKYAQTAEKIRSSNLPEWSKKKALEDIAALDSRAQLPEAPKWDFLGDTGRAAKASAGALVDDAKSAFAPPTGNPVDEVKKFGNALRMPLDALGLLSSPITGAAHAGLGSLASYLPGVDKRSADEMVDTAMMGLGPKSMRAGNLPAQAVTAAADRAAAANAAQVKAMGANASAAAKDPLLVQARQAGYVLHPTGAVDKPGFVADTASGLGGKIKTQQEASARNQEVTNRLAATELGLPADAVLDDATFASVRKNAGAAYQKVENAASTLPRGVIQADKDFLHDINNLDNSGDALRQDFPELGEHPDIAKLQTSIAKNEFSPRGGVEAIKRLRFQSKENFKALGDPSKRQLAEAQREAANAIEELIDRNLKQSGNAAAVDEYRAARQQIAKSHDIEAATDAAGNVDARKLAKMGAKRPFTGNLKIIADTADRYPKSMQMPSKFGGVEKRSILDTLTALGSGGAAIGGAFMHNPMVALSAMPLAIAPFTRPLARSLALSESLQNRLAGLRSANQFGPMIGQGAVPAVTGPNALRAMLPSAGTPTTAPVAQPQPPGGQ